MTISVSDHAVMRYLERVKGMDLEPYREEIRAIVESAVEAKALSITKDGFCYMLDPDRHSVISVISSDMRHKRKYEKKAPRPKHWLRDREARLALAKEPRI